jgi:hypothetical protein
MFNQIIGLKNGEMLSIIGYMFYNGERGPKARNF